MPFKNSFASAQITRMHIPAIEGGADIVFAKVAEQLHRQCHIKHELVGPGHERIAQKTGAVQHITQQHDKEQRHGAVHAEQNIFQQGSHPAMTALFR